MEEEVCDIITDTVCTMEVIGMECENVEKAACTTITEPVCSIKTQEEHCEQVPVGLECNTFSELQCEDVKETK